MFFDFVLILITTALPCSLLALGIFLTYRLLDFADLTAEGSLLIGASLTARCINGGVNPFIATIIGALGGAICGLITGLLNRGLKIPKLLSGIITMTASSTVAMIIMVLDKPNPDLSQLINFISMDIADHPTIYSMFYVNNFNNSIIEAIVMLVVVVLVIFGLYYFFGTEYGMAIRNTGINEKMARSQGINTAAATVVCVAISNALIALGGALYVQDNLGVEVGNFSGYLVIGLASILIGEAIFGKRTFKNWLISVSLGALVYFIIVVFAQEVIHVQPNWMQLLYAILIIIALCLPSIKKGIVSLFKRKDKEAKEV